MMMCLCLSNILSFFFLTLSVICVFLFVCFWGNEQIFLDVWNLKASSVPACQVLFSESMTNFEVVDYSCWHHNHTFPSMWYSVSFETFNCYCATRLLHQVITYRYGFPFDGENQHLYIQFIPLVCPPANPNQVHMLWRPPEASSPP